MFNFKILFKGQYIGKGFFLILTRSYPELLLSAFLSTVQNFKKLKGMGSISFFRYSKFRYLLAKDSPIP